MIHYSTKVVKETKDQSTEKPQVLKLTRIRVPSSKMTSLAKGLRPKP